MKKIKETAARITIKIAEKGLKNDLESTGSAWCYQPKMPVHAKEANKK